MKTPRDFASQSRSLVRKATRSFGRAKTEPSDQERLVYKTKPDQRTPSVGQWRYFTRILTQPQRLLLWCSVALIVIGTVVFGIRGYLRLTEVVPAFGGTYTEGVIGTPQYINPLLASLSDVDSDLARVIYSGLFTYNEQQELQPDLITNYVLAEDQKTYTFFLRSNVEWHDGEKLDADDVVFTVKAIQDAQYQSPLRANFEKVAIEKVDELTVKMTLEEPFAPFLSQLTFGILPEHIWYTVQPQNIRLTGLNLQPVGTGPFKFKELTKDSAGNVKSFSVERNERYFGHQPYIDEMQFIFYGDMQTAVDAMKENKIEGIAFVSQDGKQQIEQKKLNVQLHSLRIPQYTAVFFNQKKTSVLRDLAVRQALAHAVDRQGLIDTVLTGAGEQIFSPILPGYAGYNPDVKKYDLNIEQAKQILEDAGWKIPAPVEGADPSIAVPREKEGVKLEITVATVDLPEYTAALAYLQKNWQDIGAQVNVDTYSPVDIQNTVIKNRNYEALLFGELVGSDPDPYPFWHSSQQEHPGLALSIFRNDELDTLLEEARKTTNAEDRARQYTDFQNRIADTVPALFLYNPLYTYAVHEKVHGINQYQYISTPADRFVNITNWYIETQRQKKQS